MQYICKLFLITLLLMVLSCKDSTYDNMLVSQIYKDQNHAEFFVVYIKESQMSFGSKNTIMILYDSDSNSVDECLYGEHPFEIKRWDDETVYIDVGVFSAHGDSVYRKSYLDNFTDENPKIGKYKIQYNKNYNYR